MRPLYYNAYLTTFSLEDELKASGWSSRSSATTTDSCRRTTGSTPRVPGGVGGPAHHFKRVKLKHGETVKVDLVEVELVVDSKNDYEYLLFEDYKPAASRRTAERASLERIGSLYGVPGREGNFPGPQLSRGQHTLKGTEFGRKSPEVSAPCQPRSTGSTPPTQGELR